MPGLVITLVVLVCAAAALKLPGMGKEFLPEFREGHFVLQVSAAPGTSLAEMMRIGQQISSELATNEHIATVEQQIGRAAQGRPWLFREIDHFLQTGELLPPPRIDEIAPGT